MGNANKPILDLNLNCHIHFLWWYTLHHEHILLYIQSIYYMSLALWLDYTIYIYIYIYIDMSLTLWLVSFYLFTSVCFSFHFTYSLVSHIVSPGHSNVSFILPSLFLFKNEEWQWDRNSKCIYYLYSLVTFNHCPLISNRKSVRSRWSFQLLMLRASH